MWRDLVTIWYREYRLTWGELHADSWICEKPDENICCSGSIRPICCNDIFLFVNRDPIPDSEHIFKWFSRNNPKDQQFTGSPPVCRLSVCRSTEYHDVRWAAWHNFHPKLHFAGLYGNRSGTNRHRRLRSGLSAKRAGKYRLLVPSGNIIWLGRQRINRISISLWSLQLFRQQRLPC